MPFPKQDVQYCVPFAEFTCAVAYSFHLLSAIPQTKARGKRRVIEIRSLTTKLTLNTAEKDGSPITDQLAWGNFILSYSVVYSTPPLEKDLVIGKEKEKERKSGHPIGTLERASI